ncbi:PA14 domain-containing protein [Streptomyces scopuliridis]|uniref:PA14 domain-containing protein n=1 Tax=Streptomyces scopuliridis TaxID=452529 RepID=UPI002DD977FC|nr:PA14 domain-containing protein [Streptomyces scopuliridis]WSB34574.1 PA14 domain-containing protein [Streptomyces scopuliridis]
MNPARRTIATALVLVTAGGVLYATAVPASAVVSCASPVFKRQFFANTTFSGTPKKTDCDSAIDQNWGTGAPVSGVPSNNFGVRWSVTRDFGSGGPFTFTASAQDGIRVYLDDVRKIDLWKNVSTTVKKTANVTIPSGKHTLRVDFVNWTGTANAKYAYTPRTSADVDKVKPLTPTGAVVSYDTAKGAAKLTWSRNREMDLANYRVYRRLKGSSYGSKPLATTTATSYTDSTLPKTGAAYYYEVRAVDKAGNVSGGSVDQLVATVDKTPPAAPFVEWDACPVGQPYAAPQLVTTAANAADIAWYEMQRLDAATNRWSTVYSGAKGAICDTGYPADGSKVTYRGRARDAAGNWSVYSAATTFTTPDLTPPAAVAQLRAEYRSGVPHLVWSPVTGAASYQVLQYDPATGGYADALPGKSTTTQTDVVPRQTAAVADSYRYAVRSVDARGNAATPVEITLKMADRPEAIPAFKTTAHRFDEGVMVEWSSVDPWTVDERPLPTYKIVRTDTVTGETSIVDKCKPFTSRDEPLADPDTYWTWADDNAPLSARKQVNGTCWDVQGKSETTYEYRVVTTDRYGHVSQPGPAATETTPDTERPAPVQNLTAEHVQLGVRLTWTPPADADVSGYHVWQGITDPDSGETVWKENCWTGSSLARTEMLCPTVPDGATHAYKVAATDDRLQYDDEPLDVLHPAEVSVTLPDTRPPGWTETEVRQDQYPDLYVGCSESSGLGDCSRFASYRVERWDPVAAAYVTLAEGTMGGTAFSMDTTVHEDRLGLYYYRVVRLDASGAEAVTRSTAYGIWDSWL